MRDRRGVAMVAALWLVVAIAVVVLQFSLSARERRVLGLAARDRGVGRGAALGALALTQARLDAALRATPTGAAATALAATRSADPWLGVDSLYSGTLSIDSIDVDVRALDLGARLNINSMNEAQLGAFFGYLLRDQLMADHLAQTVMDWIDADDTRRVNGDERDAYIKKGLLPLPTNAPLATTADLLMVEGVTQEIYDKAAPYITTFGPGTVNINTADTVVLRSLPGMTDQVLLNILSRRSGGQRITSVASVIPGGNTGGRGGGNPLATQQLNQLNQVATVNTNNVLLTIVARPGLQAQPTKLTALIQRNGTTATVAWVQW